MKCTYCSEAEATTKIANPNLDMGDDIDWSDKKNWWQVCKDCKEVIHLQQLGDIGIDTTNKLDAIAKRTGIPILNAVIAKDKEGKLKTSSIEFTGEK